MNLCTSELRANDLNYCGAGSYYGSGSIHIGTVANGTAGELIVKLTSLSSGYAHTINAETDELPVVTIAHPTDLAPNCVYRVEVIGRNDHQGVGILPFKLFGYTPSTGQFAATGDYVNSALVRFVKLFDYDGDVQPATEQWLTI